MQDCKTIKTSASDPVSPGHSGIRLEIFILVLCIALVTIASVTTCPMQIGANSSSHFQGEIEFQEGRFEHDFHTAFGSIGLELIPDECCIAVHPLDGHTFKACNRSMNPIFYPFRYPFAGSPHWNCKSITIVEFEGSFIISTGNSYDIYSNNFRGMIIDARGKRLDDGVLDRTWGRTGYVARTMLAVGMFCLLLRLWRFRGRVSRIGMLFGFGSFFLLAIWQFF